MGLLAKIKSGARRLFRADVRESVDNGFGFAQDPGLANLNVFRQWIGIYQHIDRMARSRGGNPIDRPADERMLYIARGLMRYNPYAQGMIAALRNHTLGSNGFQHLPTGPSAKILRPWLDRWKEDVDWWQWEREIYERVHIEGESITRFFTCDDTIEIRPIEPEWIIAKDGTQEWTFGFYNEPGDVHDITALHELTNVGLTIDACEWYHVKSKMSVRADKRGRSDFLAVAQLLDDSFKTWRNFLQSEAVRQSVAYFAKQAPGVTTQDLDQAIAAESDYRPPEVAGRRGGDPIALQYGAGIEYIQDGTEMLAVPAAQAQGTMTGVNAGLLAAGRAYHMPLVLMSGDMSANNTLDFGDESPFGATIKDEQRWYGRHVRNILWRTVEYAVEEGILPQAVLYDGTDIEVSAERRQTQKAGENTTRVKTLYDDGVISARERATMEGVDYDEQQAQRRKEAMIAAVAGGGGDSDSDLRGTVGGLQAITSLQQQFYAGQIPQAAAIASLRTLFGFTEAEAASMLPPVKPVTRQPATEDTLVTVHRNGKVFQQHRKSGKKKEQPVAKVKAADTDNPSTKTSDVPDHVVKTADGPLDTENIPEGRVAKAKAALKESWVRINTWMLRLSPAAQRVAGALGVVFDTPDDMKKFAYNPTTSGGVASHANNDFVASSMNDAFGVGLSGHIVASIAAKVLAKAIMFAKGKIKGKKPAATEDTDAGLIEFATFMARSYKHIMEKVGVSGDVPKPKDMAKLIASLIGTTEDVGFTGTDSHGHHWVNGKQVAKAGDKPAAHDWKKTPATAKVASAVKSAKGLSDEQRKAYASAAAKPLAAMPAKAHERMAKNMKSMQFHPDVKAVGLACMDESLAGDLSDKDKVYVKGLRDKIESGEVVVGGVYSAGPQSVHVDGEVAPGMSASGAYAHEWTHAIDGPDHELSNSSAWSDAHKAEGARLGEYAASSPSEGLAEFGRLVYASDHSPEKIERAFPKASAFFKENGLWPEPKTTPTTK